MADITFLTDQTDSAIADWLANHIRAALDRTDSDIAITVPGGSTPFPVLALLAGADLPWQRIAIWPGDDRIVPEDHAASNVGKIRALLEPVGAKVVALAEGTTPPRFAVALLGMGADGHIASLFPNTNPTADAPVQVLRLTPDPLPPEAPFDRLSLTIPALINADALAFLIRGADKRAIFATAAQGASDLPVARLLAAATGPVTCFC